MTLVSTPSNQESSATHPASDESDNEDDIKDGEVVEKTAAKIRPQSWRNKERMKTTGVAIALCLNLGTDPPDSEKVAPCARTECGIDPTRHHFESAPYPTLKMISSQLEEQFRNLQPRARIKLAADPTVDMIRKTCTSLRKGAKNERVLVHFNGHGVPRPTRSGEIWTFNEDFTQYIPLSIFDLIRWTGHPAMFTFDCSSAGQLIPHFLDHERDNERKYRQQLEEYKRSRARRKKEQERRDRRERENERLVRMARAQNGALLASTLAAAASDLQSQDSTLTQGSGAEGEEEQRPTKKTFIVLVPCGADETLPSSPQLPADLFTCCLTVPVQTALRWFILQNRMTMEPLGIEQGIVSLIPGKASERKTMLGELTWIFTAVTDTIAWSVLPRKLFQRLFRQDLLVASMLRHFLLAERIFRTLGCTPQSIPVLPPAWKHRMWDAWDQAVEACLIQLPSLIPAGVLSDHGFHRAARIAAERQGLSRIPQSMRNNEAMDGGAFQQHLDNLQESHMESRFFKDQLQAFETWLSLPSTTRQNGSTASPEQLPVVLQVLLSHQHRFVALDQLAKFLDLGHWAVTHALSVGIFPYVQKLLQSPLPALKSFLVRIWVRILDLDPSCRDDLNQSDVVHSYFVRHLANVEDVELASRAALVLCILCDGDSNAKAKCLTHDLDRACTDNLDMGGNETSSAAAVAHSRARGGGGQYRATPAQSSDSEDGDSDSEGSDERTRPLFPQVQQVFAGSSHHPQSPSRAAAAGRVSIEKLRTRDVMLVRWSCLVLAKLWDGHELGRTRALNSKVDKTLERLLAEDENPEVREAAAYALGMLLGPLYVDAPVVPPAPQPSAPGPSAHAAGSAGGVGGAAMASSSSRGAVATERREEKIKSPEMCDAECDLAVKLLKLGRHDGSPLVRREILYAVSRFVTDSTHLGSVQLTVHILSEFRQKSSQTQQDLIDRLHSTFGSRGPKYMAIWLDLTRMFAVDPFPAVSQVAQILTRFVKGGVDARIEAIRGRAGEGGGAGSSAAMLSAASSASASLQEPVPMTSLESDLFARAKRHMCRCRHEMEDDAFFSQVREVSLGKRLKDDRRALLSWSRECMNWTGQNKMSWDYYHGREEHDEDWADEDEEDDDDYANPRNLKAPFLQLLRTQQQQAEASFQATGSGSASNGGNLRGVAIHSARPRHNPSPAGATAITTMSSSQHSDHGGELVRRFDQLPLDLFSSSNATRPLRRSSSFQSQIFRQSSQSSLASMGGSSRFLVRSTSGEKGGDPKGQHLQRLEEVHRVDLSRNTAGTQAVSAAHIATFHPFSAHLLIATQQAVSCYDFTNIRPQTSKFSNLNIAASTISAVTWIDAKTDPLLLTCSDDGHVRVWRDPTTSHANMVTAFSPFGVAPTVSSSAPASAVPPSPDRRNAVSLPLVEWVPEPSQLLCTSSFSTSLRVWDLVTERLFSELIFSSSAPRASNSSPPVTSLASSDSSAIFAAGFADGVVRVFDPRANCRFASIMVSVSARPEPVVTVSKISKSNCMATVTSSGDVRVWDIRMDSAALGRSHFRTDAGDNHYAFHPNAPLLACAPRKWTGSTPPVIKVLSFEDVELCQVRLKPAPGASSAFGFMGGASKQVRDVTSLAWHSREIALCVGTADLAAIHVAPNTRVRGVWSPPQLLEPIVNVHAGLASNNSHHSSSNVSLN